MRSRTLTASFASALLGICLVAATSASWSCSASSEDDGATGASGPGSGQGGAGGDLFTSGAGGVTDALEVQPAGPSLDAVYGTTGPTLQFTAVQQSTQQEVAAKWSLSDPFIGTIDDSGLFTASGNAGGQVTVTATYGAVTGSTVLTVHLTINENPGGVSAGDQGVLQGGGGRSDPAWTLWYPYDKTVFPRGILPPELHSSSGAIAPTAYYLHIVGNNVVYDGFFAALPQFAMSQGTWDALGASSDGEELTVELSKLVGSTKYGPITQTWRVATGKLHGTIYYNTYDSPLAANNGAMMRIKGNSPQPEVLIGNCTVCHSISSDGSTAAAANHYGPGGIFDLSGGMLNPPNTYTTPEQAAFAALYPKNGEVFVVNGAPGGSYPPNTPGTSGTWNSSLITKNGTVIPQSGIEAYCAQSPVFSHDGTMLAFVDRAISGGYPSQLALLHYDAAAQKFSGYEVLATPPAGRHYSWPAFTPDGKWVVFQDGVGEDLATWGTNTAKIWAVNVQTKALQPLGVLNGDGYMPQGTRDEDLNFEPTILPIASGGYFWIMYTSRRTYGTRLLGSRDQTKRLWVSAFDANAQDGMDASHPSFYIAGQELASGNSRGFWALDPCKPNGETCESGDECCEGFCNPSPDNPDVFVCAPPDDTCADEFESCTTSADCCNPELECIGGKCAQLPPE